MRQNRVHLMPPMSNFYARICVKATPSSNNSPVEAVEASAGIFLQTVIFEENKPIRLALEKGFARDSVLRSVPLGGTPAVAGWVENQKLPKVNARETRDQAGVGRIVNQSSTKGGSS